MNKYFVFTVLLLFSLNRMIIAQKECELMPIDVATADLAKNCQVKLDTLTNEEHIYANNFSGPLIYVTFALAEGKYFLKFRYIYMGKEDVSIDAQDTLFLLLENGEKLQILPCANSIENRITNKSTIVYSTGQEGLQKMSKDGYYTPGSVSVTSDSKVCVCLFEIQIEQIKKLSEIDVKYISMRYTSGLYNKKSKMVEHTSKIMPNYKLKSSPARRFKAIAQCILGN